MNTDIFPEAEYFLSSFLLGTAFLFCYDAFRILRRVIAHRWFYIALEDILYWAAAGILAFRMVYEKNYGTIRAYAATGMALGMWLYYSLLSELYVRGVTAILHRTGHLIYRFFYRLTYPIRFVAVKCMQISKKVTGRISRRRSTQQAARRAKQQQKQERRDAADRAKQQQKQERQDAADRAKQEQKQEHQNEGKKAKQQQKDKKNQEKKKDKEKGLKTDRENEKTEKEVKKKENEVSDQKKKKRSYNNRIYKSEKRV